MRTREEIESDGRNAYTLMIELLLDIRDQGEVALAISNQGFKLNAESAQLSFETREMWSEYMERLISVRTEATPPSTPSGE